MLLEKCASSIAMHIKRLHRYTVEFCFKHYVLSMMKNINLVKGCYTYNACKVKAVSFLLLSVAQGPGVHVCDATQQDR